jgi:hypothetical protein
VGTPEAVAGHPDQAPIAELTALVKNRLRRMRYRPALLAGFLDSTGLEFASFL